MKAKLQLTQILNSEWENAKHMLLLNHKTIKTARIGREHIDTIETSKTDKWQ